MFATHQYILELAAEIFLGSLATKLCHTRLIRIPPPISPSDPSFRVTLCREKRKSIASYP